jgi:hypothetical protein
MPPGKVDGQPAKGPSGASRGISRAAVRAHRAVTTTRETSRRCGGSATAASLETWPIPSFGAPSFTPAAIPPASGCAEDRYIAPAHQAKSLHGVDRSQCRTRGERLPASAEREPLHPAARFQTHTAPTARYDQTYAPSSASRMIRLARAFRSFRMSQLRPHQEFGDGTPSHRGWSADRMIAWRQLPPALTEETRP